MPLIELADLEPELSSQRFDELTVPVRVLLVLLLEHFDLSFGLSYSPPHLEHVRDGTLPLDDLRYAQVHIFEIKTLYELPIDQIHAGLRSFDSLLAGNAFIRLE